MAFALLLHALPANPLWADCASPATVREAIECALSVDDAVQEASAELKLAEAAHEQAGRLENPELTTEGPLFSSSGQGGPKLLAFIFQQPIDIWGRRSSRRQEAEQRIEAARLRLNQAKAVASAQLVRGLVRLRQISEEQRFAAQALELADLADERFKRLAFLNPEQDAARRIFEWSREAMSQAGAQLDQESEEIRLSFPLAGGKVGDFAAKAPHRRQWPEWPAGTGDSPSILALKSDVQAEGAALKAAQAAGKPGLSLGPSAEIDFSDSARNSYGLSLSMQLPLWNQNQGERLAATARQELAQKELEREMGRQGLLAAQLKGRYDRLRLLHEGGQEIAHSERHLKSLRDAYLAGRIAASLALEGFRQQKDALEAVHQTELKLYETLWEGYRLAGVQADLEL
jgi:cobalt-zinc-cadmium efflux system outer membrane protein